MTRHAPLALAIATLVCGSARAAVAQAPQSRLVRGDVSGLVGWLNVNKSELDDRTSNDWYNRGLYGGGMAGWHWTEHHKTEIEAGVGSAVRHESYRVIVVNGVQLAENSEFTFRSQRIAVGQQYQFFRNTWFHPHAGAGVDLTWERTTQVVHPVIQYTGSPGRPTQVQPERVVGPDTDLQVRPFGEVGFKVYASPRGFVRGDLRLLARNGLDEVQLRFAFGVDF